MNLPPQCASLPPSELARLIDDAMNPLREALALRFLGEISDAELKAIASAASDMLSSLIPLAEMGDA